MTLIEQIQALNDPNHPDRIWARKQVELMNGPVKPAETVRVLAEKDSYGHSIKEVTDENGETWIQFHADF